MLGWIGIEKVCGLIPDTLQSQRTDEQDPIMIMEEHIMIMEKHIVTVDEHVVKWEGNQDCGPSGLQSHSYSLRRTP